MIPADAPKVVRMNDRAYLLAGTIHLADQRDRAYPGLIEAGKIKQAIAVEKLELSRCMVAQWRWACDPAEPFEPPYGNVGPFGAPYYRLAEEMTAAAETARRRADRVPEDTRAAMLADLYEALAWWQQPYVESGTARIVFWVEIERRARARQRAADMREAA